MTNKPTNQTQTQLIIRKAWLTDVPQMMPLLNEYARKAEILPRTEPDVYQTIRSWVVAEQAGKLVGMGCLIILWGDLAEIRSLVINPAYQGLGIGRKIVNLLLTEARLMALPRVFALTRKPGFFLKQGFELTRIENLPRKVQKDCVFCPIFHACDEVALIISLTATASPDTLTREKNGFEPQSVIPLSEA